MTARSRAGDRGLTHLGRGVRALRVIAALLLVLIAGLLLLQLSGGTGGRAGGTTASLFQVCLASGQCVLCAAMTWWLWFRPPRTRVDADGVAVRTGPLRLEHVEWREVLRVEPEGPGPRPGRPARHARGAPGWRS